MRRIGGVALLAMVLTGPAIAVGAADDAVFRGPQEGYDYAPAMQPVAARFRGTPGVYLLLGDSLTYASQSTSWARTGRDQTPEEAAFLTWSHCGERDERDGWYLASVDVPTDRSHTAASGVRADEYLRGGKGGLPPLAEIIEAYDPQIVLYLLGSNDIAANRPVDRYIEDVEQAVDLLLENGTVVILSTLPPFRDRTAQVAAYNKAIRALARERHLPLLDLHAEMEARAGEAVEKCYLAADGIHLSAQPESEDDAAAPGPVDEENLAKYGYLLRCYLAVRKGMEVKDRVLDPVASDDGDPTDPPPERVP